MENTGVEFSEWKILSILLSCILSFYALRAAILPDRVAPDEGLVSPDILEILGRGSLQAPVSYLQGNSYPVISSVIIQVVGSTYSFLELFSPLIAPFFLVTYGFLVYRGMSIRLSKYHFAGSVFALLTFPGFLIRIGESSHKKYTFLLVFVGIYLILKAADKDDDRFRNLLLLVIVVIPFYNYVWGIVYGGGLILAFILLGNDRKRDISHGIILSIISFGLPNYLPTSTFNTRYISVNLQRLFRSGSEHSASGEATSQLTQWGIVDLFGVQFPIWFVYSSGILLTAIISGISGMVSLLKIIHKRTKRETLLIVFTAWTGVFATINIAASDLGTFKRLIVIPGVLGVSYMYYLFEQNPKLWKKISIAILVLLVITSVFGVPRTLVDEEYSPYDHYSDDQSVSRSEWVDGYRVSDCYTTEQSDIYRLRIQKQQVSLQHQSEINPSQNRIYSITSGDRGSISCV